MAAVRAWGLALRGMTGNIGDGVERAAISEGGFSVDMQDLIGWPLVYIFIALFIILSIFLGVRIVPQSEKHVVERFGRLRSVLGPGMDSEASR